MRDNLVVRRSRYEEHTWAGASDLVRETHWVWITGGRVNSSFWSAGEPNNGGGQCPVLMSSLYNLVSRTEGALCHVPRQQVDRRVLQQEEDGHL